MPRRASLLICLMTSILSSLEAADIHVAPAGHDANPGSTGEPLQSLAAAQLLAREMPDEPVTVYLDDGTYYLEQPITFTSDDARSADAPLLITAERGASPVISGGVRLELAWHAYRDGIFRANVPNDMSFDQLFVDGQRQPMARWPNYDPTAQYFQGFSAQCTAPARVASWSQPAGGFLHAMHRSLWGDMHWKITGKTNSQELELVGGWQNNRQMGAHKQYRFVENVFEELDAAGEWYLDRQESILYFYPPDDVDLGTSVVEGVRLKHLVEFRGERDNAVRHITLRGLTFTHAARTFMENREPLLRSDWTTYRGGAILIAGAEDCAVCDCVVDQVGGNGIFVNGYNRRVEVRGCHIARAGASAISFVGAPEALRSPLFEYHETQTLEEMDKTPGPRSPEYPAECLVEDCLIYLNGRVEKQTAGVNICMAESITVRHCSIYDCPRAGINICDGAFGGHLIEFCDVFDTVKETGDHGSFNSWGRDRFWHPDRSVTARWVEAHPDMPRWDCHKKIVIRNNRWRCDHGWDIDLDDGSSHYEIYNNLCLAGGIKLREGYDRQVYNNVLVDYTFCPHVWYPDCRTSFQRNIIGRDSYAPAGMRATDQAERIDHNLVHEPKATPRPATDLRTFGGDHHSIVADARFIDPLAGDYRVQKDSPALTLGFQNFPMDRFGVRRPDLRAIARTPPLPGTLAAAEIASGGWGRRYRKPRQAVWQGATLKEIEGAGERSAVGLGEKTGLLVVKVIRDSLADRSGLRENDVILTVNETDIRDLAAFAQCCREAASSMPLTMGLWRNQAHRSFRLTPQGD